MNYLNLMKIIIILAANKVNLIIYFSFFTIFFYYKIVCYIFYN